MDTLKSQKMGQALTTESNFNTCTYKSSNGGICLQIRPDSTTGTTNHRVKGIHVRTCMYGNVPDINPSGLNGHSGLPEPYMSMH